MYGPQRYACGEHRGELKALVREHYGTLGWHPWAAGRTRGRGGAEPTAPARWPAACARASAPRGNPEHRELRGEVRGTTVRWMRRPSPRAFWSSLTSGQRRTLIMMAGVVGALHVIGFGLLVALIAPAHLGTGGALTVGVGVTAYTLGLRHAFDADHITAIDNTTRKLMAEGRRPLSVGFWFSLGHSTIVFALAFLISVGVRALDGPVANGRSHLHQVTTVVGTLVSGILPVPHRRHQRGDPAGHHPRLPPDAHRLATTRPSWRSIWPAAACSTGSSGA